MDSHNDIVEKLLTEYDIDIIFPKPKDDSHAEVYLHRYICYQQTFL